MRKFLVQTFAFCVSAVVLIVAALALGAFAAGCNHEGATGTYRHAEPMPTPPNVCTNPDCDCACKAGGKGLCKCTLDACDCWCDRCVCGPDGCRILPRFEKADEGDDQVESDPLPPAPPGMIERSIEAGPPLSDAERMRREAEELIGKPSGLECPDPLLAGDVEKNVRLWYRNKTNPGSCVQCSIGLCGCAQNVPNASLLLWPTEFGPAELHGSYPSRVAEYARKRGLRIYNVTGSKTYEWMKWAARNGRPCAIGCKTSHFQTLFGYDPTKSEWYVVDNNSPDRVDVYTDAEFRSLHRASGEWCVILDYPPAPGRPELVEWWAAN